MIRWVAALVFASASTAQALVVELSPAADTSIYRDRPENANGAGSLFVGNAANQETETRRALWRFDFSAVPVGSHVREATLSAYVEQTTSGSQPATLHRLAESWGESTSIGPGAGAPAVIGDATWHDRFVGATPAATIAWSVAGGAYLTAPSASAPIGGAGTSPQWSGVDLVRDVQSWVDGGENFGWILRGNEAQTRTAKRLASRESPDPAKRPTLRVNVQVTGDTNADDRVNFEDLLTLAQAYGSPVSKGFASGDFDLDGSVGFTDLLRLAQAYGFGSEARASITPADPLALARLAGLTVPEPAMLTTGLLAVLMRRSRGA